MDNLPKENMSADSVEAIQSLENSINILAGMIVKAVMAELLSQERIFGQMGGSLTAIMSAKANTTDQEGKRLVFSVSEAAELLGISRPTAYTLVNTGQIPCIRYCRRMLIPRVALMKMLEEVGTVKPR